MTAPASGTGELVHVKHVIGLDIGDGESALAWSAPDSFGPVEVYRRPSGERSILTSLSYVDTDDDMPRTVFGEKAVLTDRAFHFTVNFKRQPQFSKVAEFGKALLDEFFAQHPDVADSCVIFVGHPAGWDPKVTESYLRHMAVLGPAVRLLSESQSALVHVRDLNRDRQGEGMTSLENVLVIDIGSSTVDFTVVEDLIPRNIIIGGNLGCKEIDSELAALVRDVLQRDLEFTAAMGRDGARDLLLLTCRRAKEAQFSAREQTLRGIRTSLNPDYELIADRGFGFLKSLEIPREVMRPGGWAEKFTQLLAETRAELAREPEAVILTGGGSRMPFVRRLCQDAFPGARILPGPSQREHATDIDPSLSVAQGLASAGCQQVRIARFRRDMRTIVTSGETTTEVEHQIERTFNAIKSSLIDATKRGMLPLREDVLTNPPGGVELAADMQAAIGTYLVPRAQQVCETYGVDSARFGVKLDLPPIATAAIMEKIRLQTVLVLWNLTSAWLRTHPNLKSPAVLAAAFVAPFLIGTVIPIYLAGLAGLSAYERHRITAMLKDSRLAPEDMTRIVADIQESFIAAMDERASVVERFVTLYHQRRHGPAVT